MFRTNSKKPNGIITLFVKTYDNTRLRNLNNLRFDIDAPVNMTSEFVTIAFHDNNQDSVYITVNGTVVVKVEYSNLGSWEDELGFVDNIVYEDYTDPTAGSIPENPETPNDPEVPNPGTGDFGIIAVAFATVSAFSLKRKKIR